MTGPLIFIVLCLFVAAIAMLPMLVQRRPEEGWWRWYQESFRTLRHRDRAETVARDTSLSQLLREGGNPEELGYTTPDELRGNLRTTRSAIRR